MGIKVQPGQSLVNWMGEKKEAEDKEGQDPKRS